MSQDACCPEFNPAPWDEKEHVWNDKLFIKGNVPQIFHIPLPGAINRTVGRLWKTAQNADAVRDLKDFLMLAYDPSPWKSEFHLAVNHEVQGAENVKLTGTFLSKVFDGPFSAVPQWIKEMERYVAEKGHKTLKYYFYYTTCPKCAKKYGHNYVVAFSQIS